MKKLALVASILLIAGTAGAQNLLTNPGFETGDGTGWDVPSPGRYACGYNQPDEHSGANCFCEEGCCGSFGEVCAQQSVGTDPGTNYDVGTWMKGCNAATAQVYADGSTCAALGTAFATDNTCTYAQYLTVVSGASSVNLVLRCSGTGGAWTGHSVHWDDAQVIAQAVGDWVLY